MHKINKMNELNNIRKLATIARIEEIQPIEYADSIVHARVRGWWVVVKRGEFSVGDLCVYVEVDSILPDGLPEDKQEEWRLLNKQLNKTPKDERESILEKMTQISNLNTRPEFEFLRQNRFHIKTRRIRGKISQGICFPLDILPPETQMLINEGIAFRSTFLKKKAFDPIGFDVTNILGIVQYTPPEPTIMGGDIKGKLESIGILITDEERIENLDDKYDDISKLRYFKTEKLEGSSLTAYLKQEEFGVCSRSIEYKRPSEDIPLNKMNVFWKTVIQNDIEEKVRLIQKLYNLNNFALQGELVGEGIQKNIYKIKGTKVYFFNIFDIDKQEYLPYEKFLKIIKEVGLKTVPIIDEDYKLPDNLDSLLLEADKSTTMLGNNPSQLIEGYVYIAKENVKDNVFITRSNYGRLSFKVKSRTYVL